MSNEKRHDIIAAEAHDTGVNLGDHIPLVYSFRWDMNTTITSVTTDYDRLYSWRWYKSDCRRYYDLTYLTLCNIDVPNIHNCKLGCCDATHTESINSYYENIVYALKQTAQKHIIASSMPLTEALLG